ncbi:peptide-methionine (S)-S-oxide reductase MsrA [Roseibium sp.]|uniref:peptide-methionine (S)-S-oxide reductase MsrA n=1 Tax=Roseibium sp. TaxID=1936156 RepID=UPI003A96EA88
MSFMSMLTKKFTLPSPEEALPGRSEPIVPDAPHYVSGRALQGPYPQGCKTVLLGMGCFWGAERLFWQLHGVWVTAVGYAGGFTPNPTYNETCTGRTGHTEAVLVVYDPEKLGLEELLRVFWENHDPTQGMRQGNDTGTQYRSAIYVADEGDLATAQSSMARYQDALRSAGVPNSITTEIRVLPEFYFAEDYHQQYLAKNPSGYCGIAGTGVSCPGAS